MPTLKQIGYIAGTHGYKGFLSLKLNSLIPINNKEYLFITIDGKGVPFFIEETKGDSLIKLRYINSSDEAQKYTGLEISIEIEEGKLEVEEETIIGFSFIDNITGTKGLITNIATYPQGEMWETLVGESQILLPQVEDWITGVDPDKKIIYLDLPEGLLDL